MTHTKRINEWIIVNILLILFKLNLLPVESRRKNYDSYKLYDQLKLGSKT